MRSRLGFLLLSIIGLSGCSSSEQPPLTIQGTWVSTKSLSRGSFTMQGRGDLKGTSSPGAESPLSGTLTLRGPGQQETTDEVSGKIEYNYNPPQSSYQTLEFATADGKVGFHGTIFDAMIGSYQNGRAGDEGGWHDLTGPAVDCAIDRSFQTSHTYRDLAFAGGSLYATAQDEKDAKGPWTIVKIDPASGAVTPVQPTPACTDPTGIAHDGTSFWVICAKSGAPQEVLLLKYDASWSQVGKEVSVQGFSRATAIAWKDGKLWFSGLLSLAASTIDPATGAVTASSALSPARSAGLDFVGDKLWSVTFPPGGVWSELEEYELSGALKRRVYAPENKSSGSAAVAGEPGFLWVACGHNLHRVRL